MSHDSTLWLLTHGWRGFLLAYAIMAAASFVALVRILHIPTHGVRCFQRIVNADSRRT